MLSSGSASDGIAAIGFVYDAGFTAGEKGLTIQIENMPDPEGRKYKVLWYNTWTGEKLTADADWSETNVTYAGGELSFPVAQFSLCQSTQPQATVHTDDKHDVAFKVRVSQ